MFSLQCGILVLLLILGQGGGVKKKPTSKDERAGRFPPTPPPTSPPRQWLFSPYHSSDSDDPRVVLDLPLASDPQVVWPRLRFCSTHTSTMIIVMYHRGLVYDVSQPSQHFWVVSTFDKTIPWHRADLSPLLAKRSLWTTEEQKKIR